MNLLIDVGNTRLKWAMAEGQKMQEGRALLHARQGEIREVLLSHWRNLPRPARAAVACVAASDLLEQVLWVLRRLWPGLAIIQPRSQAHGHGVTNAYRQPEKLGIDRWLALLAVRHHHGLPACVVDCGTAITLDILDVQGRHLGGMIAPGLTMMKQALVQGTETLQSFQDEFAVGLADATDAAIDNGALFAAVGLVEAVVARQGQEMLLLFTGGDARRIAGNTNLAPVIEPDLVLQGLTVILQD